MSISELIRKWAPGVRPSDEAGGGPLPGLLDGLERLREQQLAWREIVEAAGDLAVPHLCDWCVVTLQGGEGGERQQFVAHSSSEARRILDRALRRDPVELNRRHLHAITTDALATGKPVVVRPASDWTLRFYGSNPSDRYFLENLTPKVIAAYPLISRGSTIGVLMYAVLDPTLEPGVREHQARFARRAASIIDQALQVAELERARTELLEARARVYSILDPDVGAVATAGKDWELTYLNAAAERLMHLERNGKRSRSIRDALPKRAIGSPLWDVWIRALTEGRGGAARFVESWSGESRWLEARAHPLTGGGAAIYVRDVTQEQERAERLQQHEQGLREAQKFESIGRLTGGVAHDFNNILMAINGHAELALRKIPEEHPSRVSLKEVRSSAERGAHLIRQLLTYSRKGKQQRRPVDLPEIVANLEASLLRLLGEDIELSVRSQWDVPPVMADVNQLEQVIMNLAVNARDAMPSGGRLQLDIERRRSLGDEVELAAETPADGWVVFSTSDSGVGIPEQVLPHVFEPFFTTKSDRSGTGLGLSTVHGIVRQHGGTIAIDSDPGTGTLIRIYLPACARSEELPSRRLSAAPDISPAVDPPVAEREDRLSAPRRKPHAAPLEKQGPIVVVEDEERVLAFICSALKDEGYDVIEARNGADALAVLKRHEGEIGLLLTDVVMPYMGGRELGERLAEIYPEIKVIYMSGYEENEISRNGDVPADVVLIEKPFSSAHLLEVVEHVLDGTTTALPCVA